MTCFIPRRTGRSVVALATAALGTAVLVVPARAGVASGAGDSFAAPIAIAGGHDRITQFNTSATGEAGEPFHAVSATGVPDLPDHSIWFRWTSPGTGHVTFRTRDSDFDTVMAAYTGTSLPALTQIASDDDSDMPVFGGPISTRQSQLNFSAVKGTTYRIAVDSFTGVNPPESVHTGTVKLSWNANDDFSGAQAMTGEDDLESGDTTGATAEPGEPLHNGHLGGRSIWYRWTAPKSGAVSFDTSGSEIDTLLAAYTGKNVTHLTEVASNDDIPGTRTSRIVFTATAGTTYRIAVDGYAGTQGVTLLQLHYGGITAPDV